MVSLDGQWQVIVDPYDTGSFDYHGRPLTNNNAFFKNYKPQSASELVEYDFDTSGYLNVPGDWNTQRESLLFYEGSVWYKRSTLAGITVGQRMPMIRSGPQNSANRSS